MTMLNLLTVCVGGGGGGGGGMSHVHIYICMLDQLLENYCIAECKFIIIQVHVTSAI